MYRTIVKIILVFSLVVLNFTSGNAFAHNAKRLVKINDVEYTDEDFKHWWNHWNENDQIKSPPSPDTFVTFQLMVQQGHEMGYETQPNYLHKLEVFLQVRALMKFKYDEVDSKAIVTDADLKKYFDDYYGTIWNLQILTFDAETQARKVYDEMLPLKGQVTGRLVFADWYGADVNEKAESYDEVKVSGSDFLKNNIGSWITVVRKLSVGEVCRPFLNEANKKYILIRLVAKDAPGEGAFAEKRQKITEILVKEKRNQLTFHLIEKLKKQYNVHVDKELFDSIKLDNDYPNEFLDRKIIVMNGYEATARDFLYNIKKEQGVRKGVADGVIKELVLNSIISQILVNKESLARGYEKQPPLLWTYDFYKQNRLRLEVEGSLMSTLNISDQDIQNYYDLHLVTYSDPEKLSFILLKGDEAVLKKVWLGTLQGNDISESAKKYSLESNIQNHDAGDLSPVLLDELKKLDRGGISVPFGFDGTYAMVKLNERTPGQIVPYEQVKNKVLEQLKKERFEVAKTDYIEKLKSKSKIDVDQKVWNDLVRELANEKKD